MENNNKYRLVIFILVLLLFGTILYLVSNVKDSKVIIKHIKLPSKDSIYTHKIDSLQSKVDSISNKIDTAQKVVYKQIIKYKTLVKLIPTDDTICLKAITQADSIISGKDSINNFQTKIIETQKKTIELQTITIFKTDSIVTKLNDDFQKHLLEDQKKKSPPKVRILLEKVGIGVLSFFLGRVL